MKDDRELLRDEAFRKLHTPVEPRRGLWPDIERRITKKRGVSMPYVMPAAAAVILMIAATILWVSRHAPMPPAFQAYEHSYRSEVRHIQARLQTVRLSEDTVRLIEENIDEIDRSVERIFALLEKYPNAPELQELLFDIHERRMTFLYTLRLMLTDEADLIDI